MKFDDLNSGVKRVPVCLCLDTESGMKLATDEALKKAVTEIDGKHPGVLQRNNRGNVYVTEVVDKFYEELPLAIRRKYGMTQKEMLSNLRKIDSGENQTRKILQIFFKTLREKKQKDIAVDVCILTFSGDSVNVFVPFTERKEWDSDKWLEKLQGRVENISYENDRKILVTGLDKGTDMLEEHIKSYKKGTSFARGRLVFLTRPTPSGEPVTQRLRIKNSLQRRLINYKVIPVILGKGQEQANGQIAGIKFPEGTKFINASDKTEELEKIFEAISVSVSSNSPDPVYSYSGPEIEVEK